MANLEEKLQKIKTVKGDIKTSIEQVGGKTLTEEFDTYPQAILDLAGSAAYTHPEVFYYRTNGGKNLAYLYYGMDLYDEASPNEIYDNLVNHSYPNATDASYMFAKVNTKWLIMNNWNVPNLQNMDYMFTSMTAPTGFANGIEMYGWNCQPTSMIGTYKDSRKLMDIRLGKNTDNSQSLDTSKVQSMKWIFMNCDNLQAVYGVLDCSSLSDGLYGQNSSTNVFYGLNKLETITFANIYKDCTITNDIKWSVDLSNCSALTSASIKSIIDALPTIDSSYTNIYFKYPTSSTYHPYSNILAEKNWTIKQ